MTDADSLAFEGAENASYRFFALATDGVGNAEQDRPALVETRFVRPVGVEDEGGVLRFGLDAPRPNPARGAVSLVFTLDGVGDGSAGGSGEAVRLSVYDVLGRRVAVLADGAFAPGRHGATWEADGVASGVYFVRLEQGRRHAVQRVVLAR